MITHLHISCRFEKTLNELEHSSGEIRNVVWRTRDLIARMKNGDDPVFLPGQTRHGEGRIRNCRKFDLGSGYRLVTIQEGTHMYFEYVGSHDQCHQWIENNRGLVPAPAANERIVPVLQSDEASLTQRAVLDDEYENTLMKKIDDKTLRSIFSGICCPS
jgi:hypothetical protein